MENNSFDKKTNEERINEEVKKLQEELLELNRVNQSLKFENFRLQTKIRLDKEFYDQQKNIYTAAAADLLLYPNPVKVHGIYKTKGLDFMVQIMNVLLIESKAREKIIYLKEPIRPIEGGKPHSKISINGGFWKTLHLIQNMHFHLIRVSKSYAVNIHYYILDEPNKFILNIDTSIGTGDKFKKIRTDKVFDQRSYLEAMNEFAILNRYKNG
jgi:hypothetical protein